MGRNVQRPLNLGKSSAKMQMDTGFLRLSDCDKLEVMYVADTVHEALEKDVTYYLGDSCRHDHKVLDLKGKVIKGKSIRYSIENKCVICKAMTTRRSKSKRLTKGQVNQRESRRTLEDIADAKSLGMTLEEYKEFVS